MPVIPLSPETEGAPAPAAVASTPLPFIEASYLEPYYAHLAPVRGETAVHIEVDGGSAWLSRHRLGPIRILELPGRGSADYSDLSYGSRRAGVDLLRTIMNRTDVDVVVLRNVPGRSPTIAIARELARTNGWHADRELAEQAPYVAIQGTWEELYARLRGHKSRYNLGRKYRRLQDMGTVEIVDYGNAEEVDKHLDDAFDLYARRPRGLDTPWRFSGPLGRRMYRDIVARLCAEGVMSLAFLRVDGRPAAFTYGIRHAGTYYYYIVGTTDDAAVARLSPGVHLLQHLLKDSVERGLTRFDLMLGAEPYKSAWATGVEDVYTVALAKRGLRPGAAWRLYVAGARARQWARHSQVARSALKALTRASQRVRR